MTGTYRNTTMLMVAGVMTIGALIISEAVLTYGNKGASHPIRAYLGYRARSLTEGIDPLPILSRSGYLAPFDLIGTAFARIDWLQMGMGIVFAVATVYAASEYRRRRLDG